MNKKKVLSIQDIKSLLDVDKQKVMPLYPLEISQYIFEKQNPSESNTKRTLNFLIIDCRIKKSGSLPSSMEISPSILENPEVLSL